MVWIFFLQVDTPLCSARRLGEVVHEVNQFFNQQDDLSAEYDSDQLNYIMTEKVIFFK